MRWLRSSSSTPRRARRSSSRGSASDCLARSILEQRFVLPSGVPSGTIVRGCKKDHATPWTARLRAMCVLGKSTRRPVLSALCLILRAGCWEPDTSANCGVVFGRCPRTAVGLCAGFSKTVRVAIRGGHPRHTSFSNLCASSNVRKQLGRIRLHVRYCSTV